MGFFHQQCMWSEIDQYKYSQHDVFSFRIDVFGFCSTPRGSIKVSPCRVWTFVPNQRVELTILQVNWWIPKNHYGPTYFFDSSMRNPLNQGFDGFGRISIEFCQDSFLELTLSPSGTIWMLGRFWMVDLSEDLIQRKQIKKNTVRLV